MRKWGVLAAVAAALAAPAAVGVTDASAQTVPAYGMGALKAEWQAGDGTWPTSTASPTCSSWAMRRSASTALVSGATGCSRRHLLRVAAARPACPRGVPARRDAHPGPDRHARRVLHAAEDEHGTRRLRGLRAGRGAALWPERHVLARVRLPEAPVKFLGGLERAEHRSVLGHPLDPALYGYLLRDVRAALRKADPSARIVFGGLAYPTSYSSTRYDPNAFLRQAIATVGRDGFDALAVHVYRAGRREQCQHADRGHSGHPLPPTAERRQTRRAINSG